MGKFERSTTVSALRKGKKQKKGGVEGTWMLSFILSHD